MIGRVSTHIIQEKNKWFVSTLRFQNLPCNALTTSGAIVSCVPGIFFTFKKLVSCSIDMLKKLVVFMVVLHSITRLAKDRAFYIICQFAEHSRITPRNTTPSTLKSFNIIGLFSRRTSAKTVHMHKLLKLISNFKFGYFKYPLCSNCRLVYVKGNYIVIYLCPRIYRCIYGK